MLKAFVAEYKVEYGAVVYPKNEERLIIADFFFIMEGNKIEVIPTIEVQLMLIVSMIWFRLNFSNYFVSPVPTLFTKIPTSN